MLALCALVAAPAAAQDAVDPNVAAREAARTLANQGFVHVQQGRYEQAIAAFREAEERFHAPTILIQLARAHEKLGQLLEARDVYRRVVSEQLANYAPVEFFDAQKTAAAEIQALEKRIPTLELVLVTDAPRQQIDLTLDGVAVPVSATGPLPQNPGLHTIAARASGRTPLTREVTLAEGAAERVQIELIAPPPPPPARPAPAPAPRPKALPPRATADQGGSIIPALIGFGVGAAGLGAGAITGGLAMSKIADLEERCPDHICEQSDKADYDVASRLSTASTVSFIVGGVGAAAGVTLLILRPGGRRGEPERTGLMVGPTWIGWKGGF